MIIENNFEFFCSIFLFLCFGFILGGILIENKYKKQDALDATGEEVKECK